MGGFEVKLMGTSSIRRRDGTEFDLAARPAKRTLVALLALRARQIVHASVLTSSVWPDGTSTEAALLSRLRYNISTLRSEIGDRDHHLISTHGSGYRLNVSADAIDFEHFTELARKSLRAAAFDAERALELGIGALSIWDEPFAGLRYVDFAQDAISVLECLHGRLLLGMARAELSLGRPDEALERLASMPRTGVPDERRAALEMIALCQSGRHAQALETFREVNDALAEIGLVPSLELRQLEERVVAGDPALHAVQWAVPAENSNLRQIH